MGNVCFLSSMKLCGDIPRLRTSLPSNFHMWYFRGNNPLKRSKEFSLPHPILEKNHLAVPSLLNTKLDQFRLMQLQPLAILSPWEAIPVLETELGITGERGCSIITNQLPSCPGKTVRNSETIYLLFPLELHLAFRFQAMSCLWISNSPWSSPHQGCTSVMSLQLDKHVFGAAASRADQRNFQPGPSHFVFSASCRPVKKKHGEQLRLATTRVARRAHMDGKDLQLTNPPK